jgi:predicted nuclease of predicted toxin-antitoxin system
MRIPLDMNLSPAWVQFFDAAGIESVHWTEVGAPGAEDNEIMAWAREHACIVMTADLDFSAILAATNEAGPSVLQIRADLLTPDALGPTVLDALSKTEAELQAGAIVSLDRMRMRVRILPLGD